MERCQFAEDFRPSRRRAAKPAAETPAALWAKVTAPADDVADQDAAEGTDVKKTLWNDMAPLRPANRRRLPPRNRRRPAKPFGIR